MPVISGPLIEKIAQIEANIIELAEFVIQYVQPRPVVKKIAQMTIVMTEYHLRVFEKQIQTIHYFLLPKDISDVPLTFLDQVRAFLAFFSLNFPESLLKLIQHELRTNLVSLIVLENE